MRTQTTKTQSPAAASLTRAAKEVAEMVQIEGRSRGFILRSDLVQCDFNQAAINEALRLGLISEIEPGIYGEPWASLPEPLQAAGSHCAQGCTDKSDECIENHTWCIHEEDKPAEPFSQIATPLTEEWREEIEQKVTAPSGPEPLLFDGLKMKSRWKDCWIYVGSESDCRKALEELAELGIDGSISQHGTRRHKEHIGEPPLWKLFVPAWVSMDLFSFNRLQQVHSEDGAKQLWIGTLDDCLLKARILGQQAIRSRVIVEAGVELAQVEVIEEKEST